MKKLLIAAVVLLLGATAQVSAGSVLTVDSLQRLCRGGFGSGFSTTEFNKQACVHGVLTEGKVVILSKEFVTRELIDAIEQKVRQALSAQSNSLSVLTDEALFELCHGVVSGSWNHQMCIKGVLSSDKVIVVSKEFLSPAIAEFIQKKIREVHNH
ncbi:MAG: hypothetical protein Q8R25_01555 [bacterium]|nr:hypothetical protein [bacterium]